MPSRRDLIRMSDDEVEVFLHERQTMNIASFGPDGNIHLVAMWYGFLGRQRGVRDLRQEPEGAQPPP